jgi:16S rRNA (cytidine1402-2'-O)-methyltransferase
MDGESGGARVQRLPEGEGAGALFVVATPIGNLEDMTPRAIRILREVDLIAAEDTRRTRQLLSRFGIRNRLVSHHEHNRKASGRELIRLLEEGRRIALVTDAGTPGVADPGAELVAEAANRNIPVIPVPGPSAALAALVVSGLPTDRFLFAGFPPRGSRQLEEFLDGLEAEKGTIVLYEAPHRLQRTLAALAGRWPERRMALARELTKLHEEIVRGTVAEVAEYAARQPALGEYCLVVEGAKDRSVPAKSGEPGASGGDGSASPWWSGLSIAEHVARYERETGDRKEAMRLAAKDRGLARRDVYRALLESREK